MGTSFKNDTSIKEFMVVLCNFATSWCLVLIFTESLHSAKMNDINIFVNCYQSLVPTYLYIFVCMCGCLFVKKDAKGVGVTGQYLEKAHRPHRQNHLSPLERHLSDFGTTTSSQSSCFDLSHKTTKKKKPSNPKRTPFSIPQAQSRALNTSP